MLTGGLPPTNRGKKRNAPALGRLEHVVPSLEFQLFEIAGLVPFEDGEFKFLQVALGVVFDLADGSIERMAVHVVGHFGGIFADGRSEEHTSELQSLMRISYAVFCLKKKTKKTTTTRTT